MSEEWVVTRYSRRMDNCRIGLQLSRKGWRWMVYPRRGEKYATDASHHGIKDTLVEAQAASIRAAQSL